jgi:hypothetical protein
LQLSDNVLRSLIVKTDKIRESKPEDTEKPEKKPVITESEDTSPAPVASE